MLTDWFCALFFKEHLAGKNRVDRILHFHYLVCMLLPVLKQIKEDHHVGVETKAKIKGSDYYSSNLMVAKLVFLISTWISYMILCMAGKKMNDIIIKPVKFGCNEKNYW